MTCENRSGSNEAIANVDVCPRRLNTLKVGPGEFYTVLMQRLNKTPQVYGPMRGNRTNSSPSKSFTKLTSWSHARDLSASCGLTSLPCLRPSDPQKEKNYDPYLAAYAIA